MRYIYLTVLFLSFFLTSCGPSQNNNEISTKDQTISYNNSAAANNLHPSWNNEALQIRCYTQIDEIRTYIHPTGMLTWDGNYFNSQTYDVVKLRNQDSISIKVSFLDLDENQLPIIKPQNFKIELSIWLYRDPSKPNEFVHGEGKSIHTFNKGSKKISRWPSFNYEFGCEVHSVEK